MTHYSYLCRKKNFLFIQVWDWFGLSMFLCRSCPREKLVCSERVEKGESQAGGKRRGSKQEDDSHWAGTHFDWTSTFHSKVNINGCGCYLSRAASIAARNQLLQRHKWIDWKVVLLTWLIVKRALPATHSFVPDEDLRIPWLHRESGDIWLLARGTFS